jgi:hypothetical protein
MYHPSTQSGGCALELAVTHTKSQATRGTRALNLEPEQVLVTASHLAAALVKLLLFGFDEFFPLDCVFSASATSKTTLFMRCVCTA